jgi:hypothetical protein
MNERFWEDVVEGEELPTVVLPLTIHHRDMEIGAGDRITGSTPAMYANTLFLQEMLERTVREYIGPCGSIQHIHEVRMHLSDSDGETVMARGTVVRKFRSGSDGLAELKVWSEHRGRVFVVPGSILVSLPVRDSA